MHFYEVTPKHNKWSNNNLILILISLNSITDSELEPLRAQLAELDQSVVDQVDAIAMVKANILKNDEKIKKMMGSVAFSWSQLFR